MAMSIEANRYRKDLSDLLKAEPDKQSRRDFLRSIKEDPQYQAAKQSRIQDRKALHAESVAVLTQVNPLDELTRTERPLNRQEEMALWAYQVQADYEVLPKNGSSDTRRRVKRLVDQVSDRLIADPELVETASSVWGLRPDVIEKDETSLYQVIAEDLRLKARKEWRPLKAHLGDLIRIYTHRPLAGEMVGAILKGYFQGLDSPSNAAEGFYYIADAALDLITDTKSLEQAVLMLNFKSVWTPKESALFANFVVARTTIDDDRILQRAYIADNMAFNLAVLTSLDPDQLHQEQVTFRKSDFYDKVVQGKLDRYSARLHGRLGREEMMRRIAALDEANYMDLRSYSVDQLEREGFEWPFNLIHDESNPVVQKYGRLASSKVSASRYQKKVDQVMQEAGVTQLTRYQVTNQDGVIFNITAAGDLDPSAKAALVRHITKHTYDPQEIKKKFENTRTPSGTAAFAEDFDRMGNTVYFVQFRSPTEIEAQLHPINSLEAIGLPQPQLNEGERIEDKIRSLHERLLREKSRYLNARGFRVPFRQKDFTSLGYQSIAFYGNRQEQAINIELTANDTTYKFDLDRYFNLDLKGKSLDSQHIEQGLQYIVYSALQQMLCEPAEGKNGLPSLDEQSQEVISRVAHLRFLPSGQHFTREAYLKCFQEQGDDLFVLTATRQVDFDTDKVTTYVGAVTETEDNLPPIEINLKIPGFN